MVLLVVRWNARLSDGRSRSNELDGCNLKEKHEKPTSRTNQCRSESNDWQTNVEGKNYYKIWLKIKWIWRMHLVEYSTNICLFNRRWYSIGCIFENPLYNKYSYRPTARPADWPIKSSDRHFYTGRQRRKQQMLSATSTKNALLHSVV